MRPAQLSKDSSQLREEAPPDQTQSASATSTVEEQGLRQSYGITPSGLQREHSASSSDVIVRSDPAAIEPMPTRLATIVSGVSASGTPSAAEMHSLESQVQHLA